MFKNRLGLFGSMMLPFYAPDGADGGGGGNFTGGGDNFTPPSASGGSNASDSPAEPSVIDLDENALIRVKGSDKPVKFGEYGRSFQSQFTKASQRAAQLEKTLKEREGEIQRFRQQSQNASQNVQNGAQGDVFAALKQLPYLTGEHAVEVVQGIANEIKQRDMVTLGILKQFQTLQNTVKELYGNHVNSSFDSKINRWVSEGGYPAEITDWAKKLYLAYEGDDLDQEFPEILRNEWESLNKVFEAKRAQQVSQARSNRFVPGKGGNGRPSNPLQFKGNESPAAMADALFENLNGFENT